MLKQIEMDTKINYMESRMKEFMMKDDYPHQKRLQRDSTKSKPQSKDQTPTKISKSLDNNI